MKLTLTTDDGVLIEQWDIEDNWGDLTKDGPQRLMVYDIVDEWRKAKEQGAE